MGGSNFRVSGNVVLDTGQAAAGAKQVEGAITGIAKSGVAAFEAARQKVIELTQQMGALRNEILKTDDPAKLQQLQNSLGETRQRLLAARTEMRGMGLASAEANQKAALLAGTFGIQIPQGLGQLIAKSQLAQQALGAAFNVSIVLAVGAAILALLPKIAAWIDDLRGVEKVNQQILASTAKLNAALGAFGKVGSLAALNAQAATVAGNLAEATKRLKDLRDEAKEPFIASGTEQTLGVVAEHLKAFQKNADAIKNAEADVARYTKDQEELNKAIDAARVDEHAKATDKAAEASKRAAEAARQFADRQAQLKAQLEGSLGALQSLTNFYDQEKKSAEETRTALDSLNAMRTAGLADAAKFSETAVAGLVSAASATEEFDKAFNTRMLASASQGLGALAKIEFDRQQEIVKIHAEAEKAKLELMANTNLSAEQYADDRVRIEQETAQQITAVNAAAAREIALEQKQQLQKTAQEIESFIDRAFLTARSLSDVFHQFLMQLLGSFTKWVSQMLASWLNGVKQTTSGGGGILGSIVRGLFGVQGSPAGTITGTTFSTNAGSVSSIATLPLTPTLSNLSESTISSVIPLPSTPGGKSNIVGGATQGAFGNVTPENLFTLAATKGALGGMVIGQAYKAGRPAEGVLGGLLAMPSVLGGLLGGLIGMIGRGRAKKRAANLEWGFESTADDLYKEFEQHQTDYESALTGMQALIVQGQQNLLGAGLGRWGEQGAENLTKVIGDEIKALDKLEKERELRAGIIESMMLPEFHKGGIVGNAAWGLQPNEVLAILKHGEGVVNVEGMRELGAAGLSALNRVPSFHGGGIVDLMPSVQVGSSRADSARAPRPIHIAAINFNAVDGPSMQSWWRKHQADVVRTLRRATRDGG
jgi:hypothetical protein